MQVGGERTLHPRPSIHRLQDCRGMEKGVKGRRKGEEEMARQDTFSKITEEMKTQRCRIRQEVNEEERIMKNNCNYSRF